MRTVDLIEKKRLKKELTDKEIKFLIEGYSNGTIKDYQMAAFNMAVMFNSMTEKETTSFTKYMMYSGRVIDLSSIDGIKIDKHSTGGIGDNTSLAIAPIIAAIGVPVFKMSGRGLGFTGGTLDKLESIPGFNIHLTEKEFVKQVRDIKISIIGQTDDLVVADKKLYALRDVTGTIASIPLIASSIMSKKLATGADAILLDVKVGSGAFMKDLASANELAKSMMSIGRALNKDVRAIITNMDRPIGRMIGNKNEVLEAIELLNGKATDDYIELVYASCQTILFQAKKAKTKEEAQKLINKVIEDKSALAKFKELVVAQKGDFYALISKNFWTPKHKLEIKAKGEGYLEIFESMVFGLVAMKLGAGRKTKQDKIDNDAGIELNRKTNDLVEKGETLFTLYSSNPINKDLVNDIEKAIRFNKKKITLTVVLERLK